VYSHSKLKQCAVLFFPGASTRYLSPKEMGTLSTWGFGEIQSASQIATKENKRRTKALSKRDPSYNCRVVDPVQSSRELSRGGGGTCSEKSGKLDRLSIGSADSIMRSPSGRSDSRERRIGV